MQILWKKMLLGTTLFLIFCAGCSQKEEQHDTTENMQSDSEREFLSLPDKNEAKIYSVYAEEEEYQELAAFLAEFYAIPKEEQTLTRYYYNYYDFNGDNKKEIITAVISEELTDSCGDPVLLLSEENGKFIVLEDFGYVHTPIYVRSSVTNGWHDIILNVYGKGVDEGYLLYRHGEAGSYQDGDGFLYEDMPRDIDCVQLLSNNLIDDMDRGDYMTIAPEN